MYRSLLFCFVFATTSLALSVCGDEPDYLGERDNTSRDNTSRDNTSRDNTAVNERDRNAATKTPFDQA